MPRVRARVIVLAGPSGSGKSHLAHRLALPVLPLDAFYRNGDEPEMPRITTGANSGIIDWDDARSWNPDAALAAIRTLCEQPTCEAPTYDFTHDRADGSVTVDRNGSALFIAEGIFAPDVVATCRAEGLLAGAYCVDQHPLKVYAMRLGRDLRESRKPPLIAARRGVALLRAQRAFERDAVAAGCRLASPDQIEREIAVLR